MPTRLPHRSRMPTRLPILRIRYFRMKNIRMKNSGSEVSLAVDAARFCVRHNGTKGCRSAGITQTSPRLNTPRFLRP